MKVLNLSLSDHIIAISSGGGHLNELLSALPRTKMKILVLTSKSGIHQMNRKYQFKYLIDPHVSIMKYVVNSIQALFYYSKMKPAYIISTGAGIAFPIIIIGKIFGSKIIFVETGAKVFTQSRTGRMVYKYSDLFIVQYKPLLELYPKASLGSLN
jgi:beta-1,4-N-acetylglucosaminyltransferase